MTTEEKIAVMQAYLNGKTIQVYCGIKYGWEDITIEEPYWDWFTKNYRVKPEPKYRPYNSIDEFLQASKKHGPYIITNLEKQAYLPVYVYEDKVSLTNKATVGYDEMLQCDKWQDGTPCGILE